MFSLSQTGAFNAIRGRTSKLMFLLSLPGSLNTQIGELDGTCGKIFTTFISWTSSGLIAWTIFFWTLFQKSTCVLWYLYIKLFKKLFNFIYIFLFLPLMSHWINSLYKLLTFLSSFFFFFLLIFCSFSVLGVTFDLFK